MPAGFCIHTGTNNITQKIFRSVAACVQDDNTYELTIDPVFTTILNENPNRENRVVDTLDIAGAVCIDYVHLSVAIPPKLGIYELYGIFKG